VVRAVDRLSLSSGWYLSVFTGWQFSWKRKFLCMPTSLTVSYNPLSLLIKTVLSPVVLSVWLVVLRHWLINALNIYLGLKQWTIFLFLNETYYTCVTNECTCLYHSPVAYREGDLGCSNPPRNSEDIGGVLDRISKKNWRHDFHL